MLGWYRSLLDLRKKYVVDSERSSKAEWVDGVIHMEVPAHRPTLKVLARIQGNATLPERETGWQREMEAEEDGFQVRIFGQHRKTRKPRAITTFGDRFWGFEK
jgi:hypothetical protein